MTDPFRRIRAEYREGRPWWPRETEHYLVLFEWRTRKSVDQEQFCQAAERRHREIVALFGANGRDELGEGAPPIKPAYFVHDPSRCIVGMVSESGIDVPAGCDSWSYRHQESSWIAYQHMGPLPPLLQEGFATYAESPRSRRNHQIATATLTEGLMPRLADLLEPATFWSVRASYCQLLSPVAASFVQHLLSTRDGIAFVRFGRSSAANPGGRHMKRAFQRSFGQTLAAVEAGWHGWLRDNSAHLRLQRRVIRGKLADTVWVPEQLRMTRNLLAL